MAYTKKTWVTGETIEATDLNHMEQGIYDAAPTQSTVASGVITLKNASGTALCTITLPVYDGSVI